ncbi:DNA repair exonuclease [Phaeovibrio sulfidiphilus]|uniref:DNA repair exonuclease n=1 Tax=Phaeovibrio sulfidiphilus TaxID=1220600 RepID=A0A8J6YLJ7_9PROT|nr:DNA repair exonuclease [Phaeovibrio sulfidiphilus]MBE1236808.1 DNA repair exonuclease [Phaeovibrio sulfidiphilus]
MIRLIHTADVHLDSPLRSLALRDGALQDQVRAATRQAFVRIVDSALELGVQGLLVAGDLFDGAQRSARTAAFLNAQLDRLNSAGIGVFYVKGNHDAENPVAGEIPLPGNVHVFDDQGGKVRLGQTDVWIHGVSFSGRQAPASLLPKFAAPVPGAVNIALLHTSLSGAPGHDPYAPCSVAELEALGFDYWALGHVHRRQVHRESPWVVMPGTPQGRDIKEPGPRSATLLSIGDGRISVSEIPTSEVEFHRVSVDVTGIGDPDALRLAVRKALQRCDRALVSPRGIVRVRLAGTGPLGWQIVRDAEVWTETVKELALETGRLWVEKVDTDVTTGDAAGPGETACDATSELAVLMEAIAAEPGIRQDILADVDTVLLLVPAEHRAALLPDEGALEQHADDLARRGRERVLALMRGASS